MTKDKKDDKKVEGKGYESLISITDELAKRYPALEKHRGTTIKATEYNAIIFAKPKKKKEEK